MMDGEPTRGHRRAILAVMAGTACLGLSACGASAGSTPGEVSQPSATMAAGAAKFCNDVGAAMQSMAGQNPTTKMTLGQARHALDSLLNNGIKNFTALEKEAPASLKNAIPTVVADFRTYEAQTMKATSVQGLLDSTVKASPIDKHAYQEIVGYTATSCS